MTSSRHLIDDDLYEEILSLSQKLGYKSKGKKGWQLFLRKFLSYAYQYPSLFER